MTTTSDRAREVAVRPYQGWFRIRWPESGGGVELVARIPGYLAEQVTPHADQQAAEQAANVIYGEYEAAIAAVKEQEKRS